MSSEIEKTNIDESSEVEPKPPATEDKTIQLQLGDIIQIEDPTNDILNKHSFLVDYIDSTVLKLIDIKEFNKVSLKINKDGTLANNRIETIALKYRNDLLGYARQNDLLPRKWVNIYFGGDTPLVITGQITNLEEDMIEITSYPEKDVIYINFAYKGIPEDLPIETIEIREKPESIDQDAREKGEEKVESLEVGEKEDEEEARDLEEVAADLEEIGEEQLEDYEIPLPDVKNAIKEFIVRADEIQFGESVGVIKQYEGVDASQQRYNIETQSNDLLEELLSKVPNNQRTASVLKNIHIMIERFQQLREQFSLFDENGNVVKAFVKGVNWKPLANDLYKLKTLLYWLIPVAKNVKKVYNATSSNMEGEKTDVVNLNALEDAIEMAALVENYKSDDSPQEQNRYITLYSDLNSHFTPFQDINPDARNNLLTEKEVETDLNMIIDNLGELTSSIVEKDLIKTRKFVIQKYNMGLNRLHASQLTGSKMITQVVRLTQPDTVALKSILTLPEPAIKFSHVNLPGTNILDKANLNMTFLNYWQLLKQNNTVRNVRIDDLSKELDVEDDNFTGVITNYLLAGTYKNGGKAGGEGEAEFGELEEGEEREQVPNYELSSTDLYKKFLNVVIPKTRVLFRMMQKYIVDKLSLVDVVEYLEPFLIYQDDLTYKQYEDITKFLQEKISDYNKKYLERSKLFSSFKEYQTYSKPRNSNVLTHLLNHSQGEERNVLNDYGVEPGDKQGSLYTNSELLTKMIVADFGNLFDTAISLENMNLMLPNNLNSILDEEKDKLEKDISKEEKSGANKCVAYTIAKQYNSIEELEADNNKTVYYDKKYDDTLYSILEKYEKEQSKLSPKEFYEFLTNKLQNSLNISLELAEKLSETLIQGMKQISEGDYAILYDMMIGEQGKIAYYKRIGNSWILDKDATESMFANTSELLCNFQTNCIEVEDKYNNLCETYDLNKKFVLKDAMKDIMNEFDKKYEESREELDIKIKAKLEYYATNIEKLSAIETANRYKYNKQKYQLGLEADAEKADDVVISPFFKLRDLILGQTDYVKKQMDIVRFCKEFTREANIDSFISGEDEHWRYCTKTNAKIIPTFLYDLANCYEEDSEENFLLKMEEIIKLQGVLSDDQDAIVDKYSGYIIKKRDFDVDEGYEEGFKVKSREMMEADAGDAMLSGETMTKKQVIPLTPETRTMSNIIKAVSGFMGIQTDSTHEFIIQIASNALTSALVSEKDYKSKVEEMAKKSRQLPAYKVIYNQTIMFLTLGAFLVAIQTMIPSIRTRKTFPGCVRSFDGFPFEGTSDMSGLNYLACITTKLRSKFEPWNIVPRLEADTATKIKSFIDAYYLTTPEVVNRFEEKAMYLLSNPLDHIPEEHDVGKWIQFLPPLQPFKMKQVNNISNEFKKNLLSDLKSASTHEREKILVVQSKMIMLSLELQYFIQKIVDKKKFLLGSSSNEPFLENACCNEKGQYSTIHYFEKEDGAITTNNEQVIALTDLLADVMALSRAPYLFCREDSKVKYPALSKEFAEETIYRAFIVYCKFNSPIPIPGDLQSICVDKPTDIGISYSTDSIHEMVRKLKQDGRIYDQQKLLRLLQIVNRSNIVEVNMGGENTSLAPLILSVIDAISLDKNRGTIFPTEFITHLMTVMDSYGLSLKEDTEYMRTFKNYLAKQNLKMKTDLLDFIKSNASELDDKGYKKIQNTLYKLLSWEKSDNGVEGISDDTRYKNIQFVRDYIVNFSFIFPSIITKQVDYSSIKLPNYWKLSKFHKKNITTIIDEYYFNLREFYNDGVLSKVLNAVPLMTGKLMMMMKATPYFTEIGETHTIFDERTSKLLFEYYFLQCFMTYIQLGENDDMIARPVRESAYLEDEEQGENITEGDAVEMDALREEPQQRLGNRKNLKMRMAKLFIAYLDILSKHKEIVDISYEKVMDAVFKSKEREKDTFTDRLKGISDDSRKVDTILKINKLGVWSKGLQKGLTTYVASNYDEDLGEMEEMARIENMVRKKNADAVDENINQFIEDEMEEMRRAEEIDAEENDMRGLTEDYYDGDYFGGEEENWDQYE
jgi:hypothetical protein